MATDPAGSSILKITALSQTPDIHEGIPYRSEVWRKSLHILALIIPLGMHLFGRDLALAILLPLSGLAIVIEILRVRSRYVAGLISRIFGWMMRAEEVTPVGSPVVLNGATWVLISGAVLTLIFPKYIAVRAFSMVILSDAAAALLGRRYGRYRLGASMKTLEGSLAFFFTAVITLFVLGRLAPYEIFLAAFVGAVLEVAPLPVNDNLRVPMIVAFLLFATQRWLEGMDLHLFS